MSSQKKIEEGLLLMRQAEKSLKTNVFKWRPEYDVAADEYMKAATIFRNAGSQEQSKECLLKAADCHKNNRAWFHAAKCYEQVVLLLKDKQCFPEIEQYTNSACVLYQQHGSPEAAATCLDKSAKLAEQKVPDMALRFYQRALEIAMIEDSTNRAAEFSSKISRILVKLKRFDEAADALRREIGLNQETNQFGIIGRLAVALVLVQLGRGDLVAAEKAFKEWGNCCDPQEVETLEILLQAFDDEDSETAAKALSSPFIRHMDVEYAILAREIALPAGISEHSKNAVAEDTLQDDYGNCKDSSENQEEGDEYALC